MDITALMHVQQTDRYIFPFKDGIIQKVVNKLKTAFICHKTEIELYKYKHSDYHYQFHINESSKRFVTSLQKKKGWLWWWLGLGAEIHFT